MKKEQALKEFSEGKLLGFIGEYRSTKAELIKFLDKKTGRSSQFVGIRSTVELSTGESVIFSERAPDDLVDPAKYVPSLKRGQQVVAVLSSYQNDKGALRAAGKLIVLEA